MLDQTNFQLVLILNWVNHVTHVTLQDTNPIFLFSKHSIESATAPSASINYGARKLDLMLHY